MPKEFHIRRCTHKKESLWADFTLYSGKKPIGHFETMWGAKVTAAQNASPGDVLMIHARNNQVVERLTLSSNCISPQIP